MIKILETLVLGETYISQIIYDALTEEVKVVIKDIMRSGPNNCEFGFDEDLGMDEGVLVFTGVKKLFFDLSGILMKDLFDMQVEDLSEGLKKVIFHCYGFKEGCSIPADFSVVAKDVYLIDTKNPDVKITE